MHLSSSIRSRTACYTSLIYSNLRMSCSIFEIFLAAFLLFVTGTNADDDIVYACDETNAKHNWFIYCQGPLLEAVNELKIYPDAKTFVDMPMKFDPETVRDKFNASFFGQTPSKIGKTALVQFLNDNFSPPGAELTACSPSDWTSKPAKLMTIQDPTLRQFALDLHAIWKKLCKKMDPKLANDSRHSLLYVPNQFIAPGGRFREFYYWDAYWIIKGLLASEMYTTAENMMENFKLMVDQHGFVPNGGRVYYLQRSQPPLLTGMVFEYHQVLQKFDFVNKMLPTLEKELDFWDKHRSVPVTINNKIYTVYQYRSAATSPRPESYIEDVTAARNFTKDKQKNLYQNFHSTAESGWDFSSRWFADKETIETVETTNIVPIDLNAILCWNMEILEYFYRQTGNTTRALHYEQRKLEMREAIDNVFYSKKSAWFDYNLRLKEIDDRNFYAYASVPLYTDSFDLLDEQKAQLLLGYLKGEGIFNYPAGIPTSLQNTSQQWDFPNGWSPLIHMMSEGFRKSRNPVAREKAFDIAQLWVRENLRVFTATKHMYEKYRVDGLIPQPGGGGEYNVQDGFGWTNGVVLDFLVTYADRMTASDEPPASPKPKEDKGQGTARILTALVLPLLVLRF